MKNDSATDYNISVFSIANSCLAYLREEFFSGSNDQELQQTPTIQTQRWVEEGYLSPLRHLATGLEEKADEEPQKVLTYVQRSLFFEEVGPGFPWRYKNLCAAHPPNVTRALLVLREAFEAKKTSPVSIDQALGLMHLPAHFCFGESELLSARARRQLAEYLGTNTGNEGMPISLFFHTDEEGTYTECRVEGNAVFTLLPHELATLKLVVRDKRLVAIDE